MVKRLALASPFSLVDASEVPSTRGAPRRSAPFAGGEKRRASRGRKRSDGWGQRLGGLAKEEAHATRSA